MIDKVHDIVLADRRLKVREISEALNISVGCTWNILHECLGMRKLSARWVPREQCLSMFQRNPKEFLRRYVTVDETWIHYYTPETKISRKCGLGQVNLR